MELDHVEKYVLISPGGNGNPLQYSCLENPMDRGAGLTSLPISQCKSPPRPKPHLKGRANSLGMRSTPIGSFRRYREGQT